MKALTQRERITRILVLLLALTLLVAMTPFTPVYAQQDQVSCPDKYHEVPPADPITSLFFMSFR
jgi:hypothetical protein